MSKVAIITGASGGLGSALDKSLMGKDYKVAGCYFSNRPKGSPHVPS